MKIPADQAADAFRYQAAALAAVRAVRMAGEAINERCQAGGDIRECKLALRRMDEVTEQANDDLANVSVPSSMGDIQRELRPAIDAFRRGARTDLQGRETDDPALLEQAAILAEQGMAGLEKVTTMLLELAR